MISLGRFRQWSQGSRFPEQGRIDYLDGLVELDRLLRGLSENGRWAYDLEIA